jgi:hypothetical protein
LPRYLETTPTGDGDRRPPLFSALLDVVRPTLREPDVELPRDFEALIHLCEQLGTLVPVPQDRADRFRDPIAAFIDLSAAAKHFNVPSLRYAAQEACLAILDLVSAHLDLIKEPANHPQVVGLRRLAELARVRAFSLNYDDLPYEALGNVYDGFEDGVFCPEYPWPLDRNTFAQVHGSVRWGFHQEPPYTLRKFETRALAREHRKARSSLDRLMDGHMTSTVPMITGLRKADRVLARPYGTYLHVLRDELLRNPTWLIVGYGFRDEHINQMLEQAKANWQLRGASLRIIVVDYHSFPVAEDGREHAWINTPGGDFLNRILSPVFGRELQDFLGEDVSQSIFQRRVNEISDQLAVYPSGAEYALTEDFDEICAWLGVATTRP